MKTTLHYYRYDVSKDTQRGEYDQLCKTLREMGLNKFAGIGLDDSKHYRQHIKGLDDRTLELETECIFNNQWNTARTPTSESGLRVFDWDECIFDNRSIKQGYWLEQTAEMQNTRARRYKCGYCGKNYEREPETAPFWCESCLGSEYLTQDDLRLLECRNIMDGESVRYKATPPVEMVAIYHAKQKTARKARQIQDHEDAKKSLADKIESAELENLALQWLIDKDCPTDFYRNCIYYDHTHTVCIGWKNKLTFEQEQEAKVLLADAPFKWELKTV